MNDSATKTILEKIKNSGLLAEIEEKEATALLEKRKKAAQQIAVLEREIKDKIPELQKVVASKELQYKKVQADLAKIEGELRQAKVKVWSENHKYESLINRQKDILIESYDPKIDHALEWFNEKLQWLRKDYPVRYFLEGKEFNMIDWTEKKTLSTNRLTICDAMEYAKRAIEILNQMKIQVEVNEKVISALKDGFPDVLEYPKAFIETTTIKEENIPSARTQFLIDCLVADYNSERVNEKYEQIMKIGRYFPWPKAA